MVNLRLHCLDVHVHVADVLNDISDVSNLLPQIFHGLGLGDVVEATAKKLGQWPPPCGSAQYSDTPHLIWQHEHLLLIIYDSCRKEREIINDSHIRRDSKLRFGADLQDYPRQR